MVDKIRRPYSRWNNFSLSPAAKATLINSSLLSIPTYNLLVYPIPDSVLSEITKVLRRFFWSHDYNGKGIHKVVRSSIIEGKPKGAISIRDLSLGKHSLLAKHIFKYLNRDDAIWVDILFLKYGKINFWSDMAPPKCPWFSRGLCKSATYIKPFCRINSFNLTNNSFLMDPWCSNLPITLKPTFINMSADFEHLNISNLIHENL